VTDAFSSGLFLPAAVLALLAWLVPKGLSMLMAEGVWPLIRLTFYASFILFVLSSAFFVFLYVRQGAGWATLSEFGMVNNVALFGRLGLTSAIIWAPIMILSVANLPRHWVSETW
jgi:hypothetical protein